MELNEYQERAFSTALPTAQNLEYMVLGLVNEAGEVAGALKKYKRGDYSTLEFQQIIKKELGDTQWYLGGTATMCELTLEGVCQANVDKLQDRKARGVIQGSGDNR